MLAVGSDGQFIPGLDADDQQHLGLDLRSKERAAPVGVERIEQGDGTLRGLDSLGVERFPAVVEAISIAVPDGWIGSQCCFLLIGQTVTIRVSEGAVIWIGEGLILLASLSSVRRIAFDVACRRLTTVEWIETILYLPTVFQAIAIGVVVPPIRAIERLLHPVGQAVVIEVLAAVLILGAAGKDIFSSWFEAAGYSRREAGVDDGVEACKTESRGDCSDRILIVSQRHFPHPAPSGAVPLTLDVAIMFQSKRALEVSPQWLDWDGF